MKKYVVNVLVILLFIVILGSIAVCAFSVRQFVADEVDYKIIIDDEECDFDLPVVSIDDNTYVSIRELCEFIGYEIDWNEKEGTILMSKEDTIFSDLAVSKEGVLTNGRKYIFYGEDSSKYDIETYIDQMNLFPSMTYDLRIQEKTIKGVTEKVQTLLGLDDVPAEMVKIVVYYDVETKRLLFLKDYYGVPQPGGINVIVVNCQDGVTTMYSSEGA